MSSCHLGSTTWLARSRGSLDSSYSISWRHQLHVEARQDTQLQRGHQHTLLQVWLVMMSSCPLGSTTWLARSRGSLDSIYCNTWRHQLHLEARQDSQLQRGHQHTLLQVWLVMMSSCPLGSTTWLARSRGSLDSSYSISGRHQLYVDAQQDTLLQRGHQHPLLQIWLFMTSSWHVLLEVQHDLQGHWRPRRQLWYFMTL